MRPAIIIEGLLVCLLGALSVAEGIRLTTTKSVQLMDVVGPGRYIIGLGLVMIVMGVVYVVVSHRKKIASWQIFPDKTGMVKMLGMMLSFAVYILLIPILGYLLASGIFFVLLFRIAGFRSWKAVGALSVGASLIYYFVFVQALSVSFPRGIIFR